MGLSEDFDRLNVLFSILSFSEVLNETAVRNDKKIWVHDRVF